MFDAFILQPAEWKLGPEMSMVQSANMLTIHAGNTDSGWVTPQYDMAFTPETLVDMEVKEVRDGRISAQVEWLQEGGEFLAAAPIFPPKGEAFSLMNQKLVELLPLTGEKPKRFRLKFWTEGKGCEAQFSRIFVHAPRLWRKENIRPLFSYEERVSLKADSGMEVRIQHGLLFARLRPLSESSSFVLKDIVPFDPQAALMLDIQTLDKGDIELHALCWDSRGQFLKELELLKEITQSGLYETAFTTFKFPPGTSKLSFKIWLLGKEASVRISGLHYGIAPPE